MKRITISILFSASVLFVACGGRSASSSDSDVNPRDTVKVPEGYTGEDSIAYIENAVLKSDITAEAPIIDSELEQMRRGDVPYFYTYVDSLSLHGDGEELAQGKFSHS